MLNESALNVLVWYANNVIALSRTACAFLVVGGFWKRKKIHIYVYNCLAQFKSNNINFIF